MKEKIKNNYIYILTFAFFVIILSLAPISGDDWGNYPVGQQGLHMVLSVAKGMYFSWEGRFISRIFIYILTYHHILFVIATSGLLTLVVYIANKILGNVKNKVVYFIPLILLLLLNTSSFSQTYTWVAGSVTYLYPAVIVLAYFYYLYQKKEFKFSKIEYFILLVVNIITPMFVENIGLAFVFGNILWLIMNRKADKRELVKFSILTIFSIAALAIMLLSPGTASRTTTEAEFYSLSLIGRIVYNIPNLIGYAITRNIVVLIMMSLAIVYVLKLKQVKLYKIILFLIIPILGVIQNIYMMIPFDFNSYFNKYVELWGAFNVDRWYFIFYWVFFVGLFFYSIIYLVKNEKERNFLVFLVLIAGCALGSMLVVPVWGERVAIFTEIIFLIVSLRILKDSFNPKFNKLIYAFLVILLIYFIFMFSLIFSMNKDREDYIEKQLQNENVKQVEVYDQIISYIWTRGPWGEYHSKVFKTYYNIDQDIELEIVNHKITSAIYKAVGIQGS